MNINHNRQSIRLKEYDYSQEGAYFITICTHEKVCIFGHIVNGIMYPNQYGQIVCNEWLNASKCRPNVELASFVVMPNHLHGIIILRDRRGVLHTPHNDDGNMGMGVCNTPVRTPSNSIGAIVRGFKSAVTKQLWELGFVGRVWQRNYYEHIIRDTGAYQQITDYIVTNPARWIG